MVSGAEVEGKGSLGEKGEEGETSPYTTLLVSQYKKSHDSDRTGERALSELFISPSQTENFIRAWTIQQTMCEVVILVLQVRDSGSQNM